LKGINNLSSNRFIAYHNLVIAERPTSYDELSGILSLADSTSDLVYIAVCGFAQFCQFPKSCIFGTGEMPMSTIFFLNIERFGERYPAQSGNQNEFLGFSVPLLKSCE
jgi:hypothetical protein